MKKLVLLHPIFFKGDMIYLSLRLSISYVMHMCYEKIGKNLLDNRETIM